RLPRLDGAFAQRLADVGDDQAVIHADHTAEAPAGLARPQRRIEREQAGAGRRIVNGAGRAGQGIAVAPDRLVLAGVVQRVDVDLPLPELQRRLDGFHDPGAPGLAETEAVL